MYSHWMDETFIWIGASWCGFVCVFVWSVVELKEGRGFTLWGETLWGNLFNSRNLTPGHFGSKCDFIFSVSTPEAPGSHSRPSPGVTSWSLSGALDNTFCSSRSHFQAGAAETKLRTHQLSSDRDVDSQVTVHFSRWKNIWAKTSLPCSGCCLQSWTSQSQI